MSKLSDPGCQFEFDTGLGNGGLAQRSDQRPAGYSGILADTRKRAYQ